MLSFKEAGHITLHMLVGWHVNRFVSQLLCQSPASCARYTVNVVIFAGGKFPENVGKTFQVGVIFHDISPISLIKSYGFYFPVGEIFAKKTIS